MIISPLNCRQILAARSDYFRAMFSHNVAENIQNKVIIEDMDPVTFKGMVNFMYTDEVNGVNRKDVLDLLKAADMYNVRYEIIANL